MSINIDLYQSLSISIDLYRSLSISIDLNRLMSICVDLCRSVLICICLYWSVSIDLYQSIFTQSLCVFLESVGIIIAEQHDLIPQLSARDTHVHDYYTCYSGITYISLKFWNDCPSNTLVFETILKSTKGCVYACVFVVDAFMLEDAEVILTSHQVAIINIHMSNMYRAKISFGRV